MERIYPYYGAVSIVDYVDDYIFDGEYLLVSEDGIYVVDENGHPLIQHISGKFWANNHAHILKGKSGFNEDSLPILICVGKPRSNWTLDLIPASLITPFLSVLIGSRKIQKTC